MWPLICPQLLSDVLAGGLRLEFPWHQLISFQDSVSVIFPVQSSDLCCLLKILTMKSRQVEIEHIRPGFHAHFETLRVCVCKEERCLLKVAALRASSWRVVNFWNALDCHLYFFSGNQSCGVGLITLLAKKTEDNRVLAVCFYSDRVHHEVETMTHLQE